MYFFGISVDASKSIWRGGSRTAAASKKEHFVIKVNGWKPLIIITKSSILDVAAVLDPPLIAVSSYHDCRPRRVYYWQYGV